MLTEFETASPRASASTCAERRAAANWSANLRALVSTQPRLAQAMHSAPAGLEWVFARDGYMTAREGATWYSGCALPLRAAQYMMRTLDVAGGVACMLNPAHAAQVRVVQDLLRQSQGVIALVPDARGMRILLGCDDFSKEIQSHRLWFAWGEGWESELTTLLKEIEGLPTPSQFVRPIYADNTFTDSLVGPAQQIFGETNTRRASTLRGMRDAWRPPAVDKLCLIAPSHFRLWDDAGSALFDAMTAASGPTEVAISRVDPNNPASASPLALAQASVDCSAIIAPNFGRADLSDVVNLNMPWITWVTTPRVPSGKSRGGKDAILLADPSWNKLALDAGWPTDRIGFATFPTSAAISPSVAVSRESLAMVIDLPPAEPPKEMADFSSHGLLWEAIREELNANPFLLHDVDAFLDERMRRARIEAEGFHRRLFIERLILPAYQEGLALSLIRGGLPLQCFGAGWNARSAFEGIAAGPVLSREDLRQTCARATALIHCWPAPGFHPIDAAGRPVLRPFGRGREAFLRDARRAMKGELPAPAASIAPMSADLVSRWIA